MASSFDHDWSSAMSMTVAASGTGSALTEMPAPSSGVISSRCERGAQCGPGPRLGREPPRFDDDEARSGAHEVSRNMRRAARRIAADLA